jgi:a disintegrin and metalloproteinase with thrombospondin motifs 9
MPWADGTACSDNHWCQKGNCVPRNRSALMPQDGEWGDWSTYGECSVSCGGGIQSQIRACDSPAPSNGGRYCTGTRIRYQTCNKQDCPSDFDFREQQCSEMDSHSFSDSFDIKIKDKRWLPKYGVPSGDECKLFCRLHKTVQYFLFKDKVKDGTPCTYESFNKCINGICHPAGCDNELYSDARLDKCGVCKGKNDTCQDIHGKFTHAQMRNSKSKYHHKVVRIPKGATNIEIQQYGYPDDNNHIALVDDNGQNILNGFQHLQPHKTIPYGGVILEYNGASSTIEKVNSTYAKRLKRDLLVEVGSVELGSF